MVCKETRPGKRRKSVRGEISKHKRGTLMKKGKSALLKGSGGFIQTQREKLGGRWGRGDGQDKAMREENLTGGGKIIETKENKAQRKKSLEQHEKNRLGRT